MLEIIFCTYPALDALLIDKTQRLVENVHIKAVTDGISYRPMELMRLLQKRQEDSGLVIVLSGHHQSIDERRTMALQVRAHFKDAYIIYIADSSYDDLLYLTNQHIRFSGYILHQPYVEEYAQILSFIFDDYHRKQLKTDQYFTLVIGKQMKTFLLDDIIYFEARNKKVFMTLRSLQIDFYESLTKIENQLKGRFLRCHSGFLINVKYIVGINFKDMEITMKQHIKIPFSQKHKKEVTQIIAAFKIT